MTSINTILKHPRRIAAVLSILVFCLYASSTPKYNIGYGDSDEFLTVGKTWGVAHPPGYPLYVTAIHFTMSLPLPGTTPTQRAHLVSGLSASLAIYFMTLLSFELTKKKKTKTTNPTNRLVAIALTSLTGATATLYWTYAQITEKYMFTSLFVSIIMYLGNKILHHESKNLSEKNIFILAVIFGLAFSHSQTILFLIPYILYIFYQIKLYKAPKLFSAVLFVMGVSFFAPAIILVARNASHPSVSWQIEPGLNGLIHFVTKNDFRGEMGAAYANSAAYFPTAITLRQIINGSLHYITTVMQNYSWWILIPLLVSVTFLWKKDKSLLLELSLPAIFLGFVQASFLNWPTDLQSQSLVTRLYTVSLLTFLPLITIGLQELFGRFIEISKIVNVKMNIISKVIACIIIIPLSITVINYKDNSLRNFSLTSTLYSHILDTVNNDSIVTCFSDRSCASLIYEQVVNNKRPDVQIISATGYTFLKPNDQTLSYFAYNNNPWQIFDIVTWNADKRSVYAVDLSPQYYTLLGVAQGYIFYVPMGYFGQFTHQMPSTIPQYDASITEAVLKSRINPSDYMQRIIVQSLEQTHFTNGSVLLAIGSRDDARAEVTHAVNLSYLLTREDKDQALATRTKIESGITNPNFALGEKASFPADFLTKATSLNQQKKNSQALKLILGVIAVDPTNLEARLELARTYMSAGDQYMAQKEYQNVLILDPKNSEALDQLSTAVQ